MPIISRPFGSSTRTARALGLSAGVCLLAPSIAWATVRCTDDPVQAAFNRALDELYAPSRQLATVDVEVTDTIPVYEIDSKAVCKAAVSITVQYLGKQQQNDTLIEYVAERSVKGNVFVTLQK